MDIANDTGLMKMSRDNSLGRGGGLVQHGPVTRLAGANMEHRYGGSAVESRYGEPRQEPRFSGGNAEGNRSKTPPGTPKKGGKMMAIRVEMLDDSITLFQVQVRNNCYFLNFEQKVRTI